ncbi:MAG: hypothetical protein G01um101418_575 [Parcubacteria group bacterium Gr01-1014_18]|nr:MAG: hypothetical protein Greene041636_621 [Parcubacteria group bacterium Greene0416_36]TSC80958.1 MAG: hypothetical protein G01um101418_575 [Parcubacteria group bacterium Gr01-1014_18]TSC98699.1 MAG: hypothetical protein Greene101420_573 [Parcubacteria group bacterium Greene1014_20]TSD06451.1 MAG: hypothetical protein Greene07142_881 [Parcubacteria group bacterium Greene0714_2]
MRQNGIHHAGIFGSTARGTRRKTSDIDILVQIDKDLSLLEIIHLENNLGDLLGNKVELVEYDSINPLVRDAILGEEVRIL